MGKLTILSTIGQPLSAEVDLISVQKDELATLAARIPAPEAFSQAKIQYSPALVGVRMTIEKRSDGQPYIKIVSTRPVNEPFIDLLVELTWAQGRLLREYTALIDPPRFATAPAAAAPAAVSPSVAQSRPGPQDSAPAPMAIAPAAPATKSAPAVAAPRASSPAAPAEPAAGSYGPVKRGETLAKIAASMKPEGVTLEQMLVSLYRSNPDAFVGNMNRLKTGRILQIPDQAQVAQTAPPEAAKEVRMQASNWNAYREKLADSAGSTPATESASAARGKITTRVDDQAAKEPAKEVLKLSKGDANAAGKGATKSSSGPERLRALEEEATAREKALAEANDRIAHLEKTIKDMQRLVELKGTVPGAKPPAAAAKPEPAVPAKAEVAPAPSKADQVAKAEPPKAGPAKADPAKSDPAKADFAKADPAKADPAKIAAAPAADLGKSEPAKAVDSAQPKPKPKIVQPPPPPPATDLVDDILGEPLYLAALGGLVAVLGVGGYMAMRRRRTRVEDRVTPAEKTAPRLTPTPAAAASPALVASGLSDDVDPLAEADLYLNFGRDAQAEEVLKEALQKSPANEEAQLKLLQIYAGRKDKQAFEKVAQTLHGQTGGAGENWLKAAAMGYALDADNSLYEAGKSVPVAVPAAGAAGGTDLDFDFELAPAGMATKTDVEFDVGDSEKTVMMQPGALAGMAAAQRDPTSTQNITSDSGMQRESQAAGAPDFTLNVPPQGASHEPDITFDAPGDDVTKTNVTGDSAGPMASAIDFNFEAPPASKTPEAKGFTHDGTVILSPENQDKATGLTMDFDLDPTAKVLDVTADRPVGTTTVVPLDPDFRLDLSDKPAAAPEFKFDGINLDLADTGNAAAKGVEAGKDDHWYDVQTKFDLAKAYQEMGDRDGAREILQEVIKEGDGGQQEEAKKLLTTIS